jgi:hypothetical protein
MCTVLLPPGVNLIALNKFISYHMKTEPLFSTTVRIWSLTCFEHAHNSDEYFTHSFLFYKLWHLYSLTMLLVVALLLLCVVLFSAIGVWKYFNISLNCCVIIECLTMAVETLFHILRVSLSCSIKSSHSCFVLLLPSSFVAYIVH